MLVVFGYLFARSAPMQALIEAHANGGQLNHSKYGDVFASMDKELRIIRWVLYPLLFAFLGMWVGVFEKNRPVLIAVLSMLPAIAFAAASFFGTGSFRTYVLQLAIYVVVSLGVAALISGWSRSSATAASA
jgi:hypothetical protein